MSIGTWTHFFPRERASFVDYCPMDFDDGVIID